MRKQGYSPPTREIQIVIRDWGVAKIVTPTKWSDDDPPEPLEYSDPYDVRRIEFALIGLGLKQHLSAWAEFPPEFWPMRHLECAATIEAFLLEAASALRDILAAEVLRFPDD